MENDRNMVYSIDTVLNAFRQKGAKNCPKSARIRKGASFAQARASAPIKPIFIAITGTVTRNEAMSTPLRWRNCGKKKK